MIWSYNGAFPAWGSNGSDSTLVEATDARESDFGTQLLDLFKSHSRITYTHDDALLPLYVDSAIMQIEQWLEFPILPRTFDWDVGENTGYDYYEVPLRNCKIDGAQYDFEPLRGRKIMLPPTAWPVSLVVGFDDADSIPNDLKLQILNIASTMEQLRSTAELGATELSSGITARYMVQRC